VGRNIVQLQLAICLFNVLVVLSCGYFSFLRHHCCFRHSHMHDAVTQATGKSTSSKNKLRRAVKTIQSVK
jgi:hypothetical protein